MNKSRKELAKEFIKVMLTGGVYFIIIFVKVLFTTPNGQKLIERELDKRLKAIRIEEEQKTETDKPTARIGFKIED